MKIKKLAVIFGGLATTWTASRVIKSGFLVTGCILLFGGVLMLVFGVYLKNGEVVGGKK
jgi:hypothetical protein